ncbi:E3 ubiquitin-protein ligase TRIM39-like [Thunnus thynnus]|uniref:E3 ubiquitin-protein ligase TRIM39-like n=1 Tax=Thunnus thynnus TaxID=8237 RepID=UPI003527A8EB
MATASCLLSEEKFLCSVCLDVFTEPVSTPCGHNFCRACIHTYWDNSDICQCPFCKRAFSPRPELHVNTIMSELAAELKKSVQMKASTPDPQLTETANVLCDVCSEIKEKAVKSCLICLTSFCEVHLEPHQRVAGLKSHTLIDPVRDLDDRMCKKHNKITELYCRTDQASICVLCFKSDHKGHSIVPLEEEYEAVMAKKDDAMANIQKMIQSRSEKISEIENSFDVCEREAEKEKEASVQVFADLICFLQRSQAELVEVIEERHKAGKEKAEGFLKELRMEVAELENRSSQLEQLSQSEDHHLFLQNFQTLCSPLEKDWANIDVHSDLSFEAVREAVTLLKQRVDEIMEELPEIKMKKMREHAVDLTLDPDTAYCTLVISQDGKQVTNVFIDQKLPNNPKRFDTFPDILAKEGFTIGKFYYEVQVKGKTCWTVGVVRESVERKGNTMLSDKNGFWTFRLDEGNYSIFENKSAEITLKEELQKVGIFVDYNKGVVSFYNVDSKSHIYSYTGRRFTEKLYPYFCPEVSENGTNSAPLIITPVPQTH